MQQHPEAGGPPASVATSSAVQPRTTNVHELYDVKEAIGVGAFGTVYAAIDRATLAPAALKVQRLSTNPWCLRELEMMKLVTNGASAAAAAPDDEAADTHCAALLDAFIHDSTGSQADDGGGRAGQLQLVIAQPLYDGPDLHDYLTAEGPPLGERFALTLLRPMLQAIESCHRAGFAHLDAKPENYMFTRAAAGRGPSLVLVDFGSAEPFTMAPYAETSCAWVEGHDDRLLVTALDRIIGTARYLSPEVAAGSFSSRSDVWSVGVCLYMLMTKEAPFELTARGEAPRFADLDLLAHPTIAALSDDTLELLLGMMNKAPALRLSATEALAKTIAIVNRF